MTPIAKSLATLALATTVCLHSAMAAAQGGPPQQVLPEGIRGGSEVVGYRLVNDPTVTVSSAAPMSPREHLCPPGDWPRGPAGGSRSVADQVVPFSIAASPRRVGGRGLSPPMSGVWHPESFADPHPSQSVFLSLSPLAPPIRSPSPRRPGRGGRSARPVWRRAAGRSLCVTALDGVVAGSNPARLHPEPVAQWQSA